MTCVGITQEVLGLDTRNQDQKRIDKAALWIRAEHAQPDDGGDDFGKHIRHEEDRAKKSPSGQITSHHDGQRQGQWQLDGQREHHDHEAVHYRFDKNLIAQDLLEIIQSDKLIGRPDAVPIEQTVITRNGKWDK